MNVRAVCEGGFTLPMTVDEALPDGTRVTVTYDVTSLSPAGAEFVRELQSGYAAFMESWRDEILKGVALPHQHPTSEGPNAAVRDPAP